MPVVIHSPEAAPLGVFLFDALNPRVIKPEEMARLEKGIQEYGFLEPVVARSEDRLLLGGHQRLTALRAVLAANGLSQEAIEATQVPVIWMVGLTDRRARILNLALNRIGGDWDYPRLTAILADLQQSNVSGEVDLDLTGFAAPEIGDLLALAGLPSLEAAPLTIDPDEVLAAEARRFLIAVETNAEAEECRRILRRFGYAGPSSLAAAFVEALRAADQAVIS